ncbi:elongation factor P 5-aminopentanone reductase [Isobaculum melis]|uniref:3-oxoacyl-[acyl-carrier protein] reductase n=1 Tax=Isobaculum melis TaxID=142588 RepID=A0A1H9RFM4_9LACT|nr:SDR family oxidoreductase [Isobaculum melis]SER71621.1 3-oxoacyl-[acyl-carrier protein] reductase [Isobaculum melis]
MKFALIIGASGDVGKAIAADLAADGWSLYLHYYQDEKSVLEQVKAYHEAYPKQEFIALKQDLTDEATVEQLLGGIFSIDAVVFASGLADYHLLVDLPLDTLDLMWKIHVRAPIQLLQGLQSKLAKSQRGRVLFISSVYAVSGSPMEVAYSTTKGAQLAFVKSYSQEVASLGITVNALLPGAIDTKMLATFTKEEKAQLIAEIPMGRLALPPEIAFWVKQILSKQGSYLTGQGIVISGGWLH